ncbi:MAG: dynamin family protein [Anaerolineae bacterium]
MATLVSDIPTQVKEGEAETTLIREIQRHLPDAEDSQVQRFAAEIERLEALNLFFATYPEDKNGATAFLDRAAKALDYRRPYRIAVIGTTGVGKSTLINALLGRKLVLVKDVGKPATGTALEIFLDVPDGGQETATVTYRDEANIRALVDDFVARYQLEGGQLPGRLNKSFARQLLALEPTRDLGEQTVQEFEALRQALADIVTQYAGVGTSGLPAEFALDNPRHVQDLMALTDENSALNRGAGRTIGLVRSVAYHIKPAAQNGTLQLPGNVCLVDLPGLDGSPLHDIIISEGIKEADAVVFILRPPRILNRGDAYLLSRVRKYISLEGALDSAERIFLILNASDDITRDDPRALENFPRDMQELMDLLAPGYATRFANRGGEQPYFLTSAWVAFNAQRSLQGEPVEDPQTYHSKAVKLGVDERDHRAMLAASQMPALADALTNFAREHRLEGQIREGRQALDRIVGSLTDRYISEIKLLTGGQGIAYVKSEDARLLAERRENVVDLVVDFRLNQLERLDQLRQELRNEAKHVCNAIDERLREEMPRLWKRAFITDRYRPRARKYGKTMYEVLLGETELLLWRQLTIRLHGLADLLARTYRHAFEASRLPRYIVNLSYEHPLAAEAVTGLESLLDDVQANLAKISGRMALVYMLEPSAGFVTPEQLARPSLLAQNTLVLALDKIPARREVDPGAFDEFIAAVRKHYEPAVLDYSINALLNVYQYEMVYVEDGILARVEQLFNDLREAVVYDPVLRARVRESAPDDDRDRVELLDRKLSALARWRGSQAATNGKAEVG